MPRVHGPALRATQSDVHVSLIHLIANPEAFDGKPVSVMGFFRYEFEGTALYVHREDYEHALSKNGIWVAGLPPSSGRRGWKG
jgi:hypothetical protein